MPPRVALIAALEREVANLVRGFRRRRDLTELFSVFESANVSLICAGIGAQRAAAATRWAIATLKPEVVMSIGFAGALVLDRRVGDVIAPATVVDGNTGESFSSRCGNGVLVTASSVLGREEKRTLAARYHSEAADMEAAAVARVAQESGIPFFAAKTISDEMDFPMPPLDRFIDGQGRFRNSKLLAYAVVRPALWPVLVRLRANAKTASSQLCRWLENQISRDFQDSFGVCGNSRI